MPKYIEPILLGGTKDEYLVEKIDRAIASLPKGAVHEDVEEFLNFWHQYKMAFKEFKKHG